jgi:hypothetical protein
MGEAMENNLIDFDIEEFKGAWGHTQHLEQERTRHLVFFFTVVGGLAATIGFLLKDGIGKTISEPIFVITSVITMLLQFFAVFVFAAIKRIGTARGNHERAMRHIRKKLETDPFIREMWAKFAEKRFRWFSVQGAAELSVHTLAAAFAIGSLLAVYASTVKLQWWGQALVIIPILVFAFHVALAVTLERADPFDDLSRDVGRG